MKAKQFDWHADPITRTTAVTLRLAFAGPRIPLSAGSAAFYSTEPLERTLNELVNFTRVEHHATRLTVGAANVRTGEMRYFDSRDTQLNAKHVIASGALQPAFPAVRNDGDLYWDVESCRTRQWKQYSMTTQGVIRWCSLSISGTPMDQSPRPFGRC